MESTMRALEKRPFKLRRPILRFFCALCRTERQLSKRSKLNALQVFQILLISSILMLLLYPLWSFKVLIVLPIVGALFEGLNKLQFRKEIPCPYCGFDATWYKRDVKLAKKGVEEFWQVEEKNLENSDTSSQDSALSA